MILTIRVGAVDSDGVELYSKVLKSTEIKLTSKVHASKEATYGIRLSSNQRSRDYSFVSVGDLDVESTVGTDKLIVRRSKQGN